MTSAERFTITILALSLIFTVLSALLGLLIAIIRRWTKAEERLAQLTQDVRDLTQSTDKRITWLEQNLWNRRNAR